ncbi:MAG: hypothetical protein NTZ35_08250 [Ignavibacteriales bacterium]|nr:hypothetical protein [Ignavibacteriales bacterium]
MAPSSHFSLAKWYLDCVTDEGEAFVGYSASLRWKALSLEYSGILIRRSTDEILTKSTLHGGRHPDITGGSVRWDCPSLKLKGEWKSRQQPIGRTFFGSSDSPLNWSCLQPHAVAEISVGDIGTFRGYGYVDFLNLPAQPWKLPLDELRWGRFLSETDSIIWMDFKGPSPETIVYHNGALCEGAQVTDREIVLGENHLNLFFEETKVLREGTLASTALSVIPGINTLLPARMLNTEECKWRSRGFLRKADSILSSGWTIHEVVRWPHSDPPDNSGAPL